jgi:hypothetical protein
LWQHNRSRNRQLGCSTNSTAGQPSGFFFFVLFAAGHGRNLLLGIACGTTGSGNRRSGDQIIGLRSSCGDLRRCGHRTAGGWSHAAFFAK